MTIMTERMKAFQNMLMRELFKMKLPDKNIIAIATMLKTEKQMGTMLNWIKQHHKENPSKLRVMMVTANIKNGVQ